MIFRMKCILEPKQLRMNDSSKSSSGMTLYLLWTPRISSFSLGVRKSNVRMISRKGPSLSMFPLSPLLLLIYATNIHRANKGETEDVKAPSAGAKSLCIPHDQDRFGPFPDGENQKCVQCGAKAKRWTLFGRSKSSPILHSVLANWYRLLDILSCQVLGSVGPVVITCIYTVL
jgi:hypothetical protein